MRNRDDHSFERNPRYNSPMPQSPPQYWVVPQHMQVQQPAQPQLPPQTGYAYRQPTTEYVLPAARTTPESAEDKVRQCLRNVQSVVEGAGLTMEHVVYAQVYLHSSMSYEVLGAVWKEFFTRNCGPRPCKEAAVKVAPSMKWTCATCPAPA